MLLLTAATSARAADDQTSPVLTGAPTGTTAESNPTIYVTDSSATSYKYSINKAPYSAPVPIDTPLSLTAKVTIDGVEFVAGSKELAEFINRRTDEFSTAPFIGEISVADVQSQLQITYLLNRLRSALTTDNTLNLRGADVTSLHVRLIETASAPSVNALESFVIGGGELAGLDTTGTTKTFALSVPPGATSATITPVTTDSDTVITVNGSIAASGSPVTIENLVEGGPSITLSAARPQASPTTYLITVTHSAALSGQTSYKSYYLKAADPATTYLRITNEGAATVRYGLTFNDRLGLTTAGIIDEIGRMAPEFDGESVARKTWRFVRTNRYHAAPLTTVPWFSFPSLFFNSAGFGYCGDAADLFAHLMIAMGYSARVWALGGHIVPEVLVDGRWEMWDPDLEVYYYNSAGLVAGVNELVATPELIVNPINPVITDRTVFPWHIGYTQLVADIYSSTTDNYLSALDAAGSASPEVAVDLPPKAAFEFPGVFEAPPPSLFSTTVPMYANARLVVPAGFSGSISASLIVHSIGFSATPTVSVISGTADQWTSTPAVATWVYDFEAPIVTASQPSGHYNVDEPVTLLSSEAATIYYTVDGSTPTLASPIYTDPVQLGLVGAVAFFATDTVGNTSRIFSYGPSVGAVTLQSTFTDGVASFVAQASGGAALYEYMYVVGSPDGSWSYARPYGPDPTWVWDTSFEPLGTYVVEVWARNVGQTEIPYGAWAAETITVDGPPVTALDVSANLLSPQFIGAQVTLTATATGTTGNYEYQFVVRSPGGAWSVARAYSSAPSWTWDTSAGSVGEYVIQVWARNAGAGIAYDVWTGMPFEVVPPPPVTGVAATTDVSSPQRPGTHVTVTAKATGTTGNYEYQFVLRNPAGVWTIVQAYSSAPGWTWNTGAGPTGGYFIQVWARNAGSTSAYEAYTGMPFDLVPPPVTAVAVTTNVPTPQITGAQVTISATATGTTGNYEYQFVLRNPAGVWTIVQAYSAASSWTWGTGAASTGGYVIQVWARNAGTFVAYDAWAGMAFTVDSPPE